MRCTRCTMFDPCQFHELAAEFNGEIPNWEIRLAEFDSHSDDRYVRESDLSYGDHIGTPIRDWDVFLALEPF